MKSIFSTFFKYKMSIVFFVVFSFLISFFCVEYIYNSNYASYTLTFSAVSPEQLFTSEYFDEVIDEINQHNNNLASGEKKISYANIDYHSMIKDGKLINNDDGTYTYFVKLKYFPSINRTSTGVVNEGDSRVKTYFKLILGYSDSSYSVNTNSIEVDLDGYQNSYLLSLIISLTVLIVYLVVLAFLTKLNKFKEIVDISDNIEIYKTPFKLGYWKKARRVFTTPKDLSMIAILFALMLVCKFISLPSGFGSLGIGVTYLVFSIITMIYGPICGLVIGFFSDSIGYFMFPSATGFFFGYTLSAMLTGFIYGIFFYRTKITFAKCLYARIFVNLFINVCLGTIWWSMIYGLNHDATITYLLTMALPKNLIYLVPQSALLFLVLKYVLKPLKSFNLIDSRVVDNVSLL